MSEASQIVQRLWSYCTILKDDGVSYGDYVEQLTYLLFLKMEDENISQPGYRSSLPSDCRWSNLKETNESTLVEFYARLLQKLASQPGIVGQIFRKSQTKIQDSAKLKRLITLIDGVSWSSADLDVKGEIYEGLLQKNAEDTKSGAGQYFTPRPLIRAIVEVMKPTPDLDIADPACGTGGFFLSAHKYLTEEGRFDITSAQKKRMKRGIFHGWEIVENTARLCLMNLHLHGISPEDKAPITVADGLLKEPEKTYDMVLSNPPFGKKSSITMVSESGTKRTDQSLHYRRQDFFATTSNKQLNFLQHIITMLKDEGKAAVVLPDNVLFEGGAGEQIRRRLLEECNLHTILRLPPGIFYAQGVKANVFFFDRAASAKKPRTSKVWIYDLRTGKSFTLRTRQMQKPHLLDFIRCFKADRRDLRKPSEFFRPFSYDEILKRDKCNLDISWQTLNPVAVASLKSQTSDALIEEILGHLDLARLHFQAVKGNAQK